MCNDAPLKRLNGGNIHTRMPYQRALSWRLFLVIMTLLFLRFAHTDRALAETTAKSANPLLYLPAITRTDLPDQRTSPPVINFFRAEPTTISAGASASLTWQVTDATKVSIEGIGDVTGTTLSVKPLTTTVYTMIAANSVAAVVAKTTVTVEDNNGADVAANFFLPYDLYDHIWSNRMPQLVIDSHDVTHVAYAANDATFYGYCSTDCTGKESFHMVGFGLEKLDTAQLAVDPAGHPRLLVSLVVDGVLNYRYGECNSDCAKIEQWFWSDDLVESIIPGSTVEAVRSFVLDAQGRPRFVHSIWTANGTDASYYVYCNANCTEVGSWQQVTLLNAFVENLALQIAPSGLARIAYYAKTQDQQANVVYQIGYLECTTLDCSEHIGPLNLVQVSSGAVAFGLRLDSTGSPRMALYPGSGEGGELPASRLYYLTCTANCAQGAANWRALDIGLPVTINDKAVYHGELGLDLALDHQDRPRMAFRIWPYAELGYAWCNQSNCATATDGWNETIVPSTQAADAELGHIRYSCPTCYPPIADCQSYWDAGWWPTLAIGADGATRIAFEAQLWSYGGACSAQALARFSRLAVFAQP